MSNRKMKTKSRGRAKTRKVLTYQPILQLPPLSDEEYQGLRASIAVNGVKVPILVDEEKRIIDGSYRKRFADEFGYDCPEIVEAGLTGEEKRTLARALNLSRRQLNTDQKRQIIADQLAETPDRSARWIAKQLGVSHPTVLSVREELESGGKLYHLNEVVGEDGKTYPAAKNHWQVRKDGAGDPLIVHPTPPHVTEALLARETFDGTILEPASGDGAMAAVLLGQGYKVEATDINEGHDFLRRRAKVANVVTNPPYSQSMAEAFVRHAMEIAEKKIAMLLPFYFLEGIQRHELFTNREWPVKALYIFSRRPTFGDHDDHSPFGCVWVVWERGYQGAPKTEWILDPEPKEEDKYCPTPKPPKPSKRTVAERKCRLAATTLINGDCRNKLKSIQTATVDCVISDPVYPEVRARGEHYPKVSEADWFDLMKAVVRECKRAVKPSGSAVFILQPNYDKLGKMRLWLWDFVSWAGREWNLVQDCWWWAIDAMPLAGTRREYGLMRQSVKMCVWLGSPDCYRNQDAVLWTPAQTTLADVASARYRNDDRLRTGPSGRTIRQARLARAINERNGTTPFNLLPVPVGTQASGREGHPAATPYEVAAWWCRYILPSDGVLLDPMCGSGTSLMAGLDHGASRIIGIDKVKKFLDTARRQIQL